MWGHCSLQSCGGNGISSSLVVFLLHQLFLYHLSLLLLLSNVVHLDVLLLHHLLLVVHRHLMPLHHVSMSGCRCHMVVAVADNHLLFFSFHLILLFFLHSLMYFSLHFDHSLFLYHLLLLFIALLHHWLFHDRRLDVLGSLQI
ncbi:hypothetical protein PFISCL1PPCAC_25377, partial [Pristionchus fissidentatus]